MSSLKDYNIDFVKLKLGHHDFNFKIDDSFFRLKVNSLIESGNLIVHILLDKKERLMNLNFNFEGTIQTECDTCLDIIDLPIKGNESIVLKIEETPKESDGEIIYLGPNDISFNVYDSIYEFICISKPMTKTCSESADTKKKCNPQMLKYLSESKDENSNIETPTDPRWDKLKKIIE